MISIHVPKVVLNWLPLAFVTSVVFASGFLLVQQDVRLSANDPQIEIAEGLSSAFNNGQAPDNILPEAKIDMSVRLDAFAILYDAQGAVLDGTGVLDGEVPAVPKGVLDYARVHNGNRITWQPKPGVRVAIVVMPYEYSGQQGFVLVGKSLREVDARVRTMGEITLVGWLVALFGALFFVSVKHYYEVRSQGKESVEVVVSEN